jgi:rare lipoprotein A
MSAMLRFRWIVPLVAGLVAVFFAGCASVPHYEVGYTQRGFASWYGEDFHGKPTADGETFDMHQMTAAHRHLPFGTMVRVTNRSNGLNVEVRINDRGPFGDDDRIIDVSSAAADILQMKRAGTVPVEIEVLRLGPSRRSQE